MRACLRDRRLGRNFRHVGSEDEFEAAEPLDPRWQAFCKTERWSLLWLEPPEHTRIRKLVAAAFTPRSVEALRGPCAELARELLPHGRFEAALRALVEGAPRLELAEEPRRNRASVIWGLARVEVCRSNDT